MEQSVLPIREEVEALQGVYTNTHRINARYEEEDVITVSSATRRIAFAYERLRNTLDPAEEHVLRQRSIARIIERRIHEGRSDLVTANALLQELIRARYAERIPVTVVHSVATVIHRVRLLYPLFNEEEREWIVMLSAVAIDRALFPKYAQDALVHIMYSDTYRRTEWEDKTLQEDERPAHLYAACHKALFAPDDAEVAYHFFVSEFPFWMAESFTDEHVNTLGRQFPAFISRMDGIVRHRMHGKLVRLLRPTAVPYRIVWDLLGSHEAGMWSSYEQLDASTQSAITERIESVMQKMHRRALHSIGFLFTTKMLLTLLIEFAYEVLVLRTIHWLALTLNVVFHPLLLFVLSTTVRLPRAENTHKIMEHVRIIVSGQGDLPVIAVRRPRQYGLITRWVFSFIYSIAFLGIFYGLYVVLSALNFSIVAIVLFVVFLAFTSFLTLRIRRSIRDIQMVERKEGALVTVATFLVLPILEFGRWLTVHVSQLNVFVFIMDLIIEAPFKLLIDVAEEWFMFVRERKEEVV